MTTASPEINALPMRTGQRSKNIENLSCLPN